MASISSGNLQDRGATTFRTVVTTRTVHGSLSEAIGWVLAGDMPAMELFSQLPTYHKEFLEVKAHSLHGKAYPLLTRTDKVASLSSLAAAIEAMPSSGEIVDAIKLVVEKALDPVFVFVSLPETLRVLLDKLASEKYLADFLDLRVRQMRIIFAGTLPEDQEPKRISLPVAMQEVSPGAMTPEKIFLQLQDNLQEELNGAARHAAGRDFLDSPIGVQTAILKSLNDAVSGHASGSNARMIQANELVARADEELSCGQYRNGVDLLNQALEAFLGVGARESARNVAKRSLEIAEGRLGKNNPSLAQSLNNWAITFPEGESKGRLGRMHKRALKIRRKTLGAKHEKCAESLSNLAHLRQLHGNVKKAIRLYREAIVIYQATVPESDGDRRITEGRLQKLLATHSA